MSEDVAGLRALSEAATPGPWVVEGDSYGGDIYGPSRVRDYVAVDNEGLMPCVRHRPDADFIVAAVAYARAALSSPETTPAGVLDEAALREALQAMWPHHTEGIGSSPPSPGDHSYEVWEPFLPGSPDSVAHALAAALGRSGSGGGRG